MASITAGESKAQVAAQSRAAAQPEVQVAAPNRREFLYYIWGASIALLLGQSTAGLIWFALPRFAEGTFGGVFSLAPDRLPLPATAPANVPEGRFHLASAPQGVLALYGVCTHLGCLPKWSETNFRFECPCHGSKFELNGAYIEGPAPRGMDRFRVTLEFADGTQATTDAAGGPIPLDGRLVTAIRVDTGDLIRGT